MLQLTEKLRNMSGGDSAAKQLLFLREKLAQKIKKSPSTRELELFARTCYLAGISAQDSLNLMDFHTSIALYVEGIMAAKSIKSNLLVSIGLLHLSNALRLIGKTKASLRLLEKAESLSDDPWISGRAGILQGRIAGTLGNHQLLELSMNKLTKALEKLNISDGQVNLSAKIEVEARALANLGSLDEAVELLITHLPLIDSGPMTWRTIAKITFAETLAYRGETQLAQQHIIEAISLARALGLDRQLKRARDCAKILNLDISGVNVSYALNLIKVLNNVEHGITNWRDYENIVTSILKYCFVPPLEHCNIQNKSWDGSDRIDITFRNTSPLLYFWRTMKERFDANIIICEVKNIKEIGNREINQLSSYLDNTKGRFGILIKRMPTTPGELRIIERRLRKGELILILCDNDLKEMIHLKIANSDPSSVLKEKYNVLLERY
jgi:tetratricopeptide (TPR) repeat protein